MPTFRSHVTIKRKRRVAAAAHMALARQTPIEGFDQDCAYDHFISLHGRWWEERMYRHAAAEAATGTCHWWLYQDRIRARH